jgi:hypothetical protein
MKHEKKAEETASKGDLAYKVQLEKLRKKWGDVIYSSIGPAPSICHASDPDVKIASLHKDVLPVLLENQEAQFKRGDQLHANPDDVYDVICKVIMRMTMPKLISIQPMIQPAGAIFFLKYTSCKGESTASEYDYGVKSDVTINLTIERQACAAQTEFLQALWLFGSESARDLSVVLGGDALHTLKEAMISAIAGALDRTLMKNLYYGVRDQRVFELTEHPTGEFSIAAKALWKRGLRPPDWIVGGLDMTVEFIGNSDFEVKPEIFYVGQARGMHVWCDVMMPGKAAVMGGGHCGPLDSGFIWSPYVLLMPTPREVTVTNSPTKIDISVLDDRRRIMTRHAMTLCNPDRYLVLKRK